MMANIEYSPIANLEAEAALLGALLIENSLIDTVADKLRPEDFMEPVHSRIFEGIVGYAARGQAVSPVTLKVHFEADEGLKSLGGASYLARLTHDGIGLIAPGMLIEQIAQLSRLRRMQLGLITAAEACSAAASESTDIAATINEISVHADAALDVDRDDVAAEMTGGEALGALIRSFDEPRTGVECGVIPDLDRVMGVLRPKNMIVLAARPGMGKTACALSYALGAAKNGHGVLFVSLEMSAGELAGRMAADMCFTHGDNSVPYAAIANANLTDWQMKRVCEAESRMHSLPFHLIDTGKLSLGRLNILIKRYVRRFAAKGQKLELVVIDYLQLMRSDKKNASKYEDVTEVSNGIKRIAKDHGVSIMALAQLSREVEKRPDKRPTLADLRDSGSIEQDADTVCFLHREEYYLQQTKPPEMSPKRAEWEGDMERAKGRIDFIVAKRRNGTSGSGLGEFHGAFQAVR